MVVVPFPGSFRRMLVGLVLVVGVVASNGSAIGLQDFITVTKEIDPSTCHGEHMCLLYLEEIRFKHFCVDVETAKRLGYGSMAIAEDIAEICVNRALKRYHKMLTIDILKIVARKNENNSLLDFKNQYPGISDFGIGGYLTLRAEENFDCRSIHPGQIEMVCNSPIDRAYIDEDWPFWQKDIGGSRSKYEASELKFMLERQERHQKLEEIAHKKGLLPW